PDFYFERYDCVTPAFLAEHGIRALLIDIDNTLAPYEQPDPDERLLRWFEELKAAGIGAALVSNNFPPRVERFNQALKLPAYPNSGKPGTKAFFAAMQELGVAPEETAGLGDQLFTDTWAAHRAGIQSIIVPPIRDKKTLFFRFKRRMERPFFRRYRKKNPSVSAQQEESV
ncbi:MAG: YqeG family HAD IIIA-type phosphatase, partial [Clostridia bacterium]|nr:YqeG family HAD IIIA-type phosphatase [Clostridia bacterium]